LNKTGKAIPSLKHTNLFNIINTSIMLLIVIITLFPFIRILVSSISDPLLVMQNKITLIPKGITLGNYRVVFSNNMIVLSYWNTIKYTSLGTLINVVFTVLMAYPLSRKRFLGRIIFMKMIAFTLLFGGGIIPTFIVVKTLGLNNKIWAVVLLGAVNTWYLIITRTFFDTLPASLEESAVIDGCNDIQVFLRIMLPLSTPILATITLFYAVNHWNSYFVPMIYLNDKEKYPLQIFLRNLLIVGEMSHYAGRTSGSSDQFTFVSQSIKYTAIVVTTLPIILVYPFLQKYFVKGVMIGSIKG